MIKGPLIDSMLEFSDNQMLLTIYPSDLLIIEDFKRVRVINSINLGSRKKFWISPLPGFDINSFPFLVCSGSQAYNLINVATGRTEPLIHASVSSIFSQ